MDMINRQTITSLAGHEQRPAVSIYIPTHRSGPEIQQDPIRLRNALDAASAQLVEEGLRRPDAETMLSSGRSLVDDRGFWEHQEGGLAIFVAPDRDEHYRVPVEFDTAVTVAVRFRLRPLLRAMTRGERFHTLTLSANQVRLLWGTRHAVGEVALPASIPKDLAAAIWYRDPERQLQFRSGASRGQGRSSAIFHGHGLGETSGEEDLRGFLRAVDEGLKQLGVGNEPVVLAGVDRLLDEFRSVSGLPSILDGTISGNVEHRSDAELHAAAWAIAEPFFAREQLAAMEALQIEDKRAIGLEECLISAHQGRVAGMFVDERAEAWGRIGGDSTTVEIHDKRQPDDAELYDLAGAATLAHGGHVYVAEGSDLPAPVAATLRW